MLPIELFKVFHLPSRGKQDYFDILKSLDFIISLQKKKIFEVLYVYVLGGD